MKRTDRNEILSFLRTLKPELESQGFDSLALFGSFAKGEEGVYSDIDIAVKKSPFFRDRYKAYDYFNSLEELRNRLRKRFHRNVDILDLDGESPFLEEIKKELIYV